MARIELPATEIVARYHNGESTPELAHAFDVSQPTIWRRLVAAGVKCRRHGWSGQGNPKRGGPLHTDVHGYLRTADRSGKMCCVHRGCWEAYRGPIPNRYVVHHIDRNILHNEIENLACMPHAEHARMHGRMKRHVRNRKDVDAFFYTGIVVKMKNN